MLKFFFIVVWKTLVLNFWDLRHSSISSKLCNSHKRAITELRNFMFETPLSFHPHPMFLFFPPSSSPCCFLSTPPSFSLSAPLLQYVPPDLCICNFVLEQSLSVRALQEMLANTGHNSEGVRGFLPHFPIKLTTYSTIKSICSTSIAPNAEKVSYSIHFGTLSLKALAEFYNNESILNQHTFA